MSTLSDSLKELDTLFERADFQKERIFNAGSQRIKNNTILAIHDIDFYLMLLRRIYRTISKLSEAYDSINAISKEHTAFFNKIYLRDHFDKGINFDKLPNVIGTEKINIGMNVKIATSMIGHTIVSGDLSWDLNTDHDFLRNIIDEIKSLK